MSALGSRIAMQAFQDGLGPSAICEKATMTYAIDSEQSQYEAWEFHVRDTATGELTIVEVDRTPLLGKVGAAKVILDSMTSVAAETFRAAAIDYLAVAADLRAAALLPKPVALPAPPTDPAPADPAPVEVTDGNA